MMESSTYIREFRDFLETVSTKYKNVTGWAETAAVGMLKGIEGILKTIESLDGKAFLENYKKLVWAERYLGDYIEIEEWRQLKFHMENLISELVRILRDACGCKWHELEHPESVDRYAIDELGEVGDFLVAISSKYRNRAGWAGKCAENMLVAVREMMFGIENRDAKTILKNHENFTTNAKVLIQAIGREEGAALKGHMDRLAELVRFTQRECEKRERELTAVRIDELAPTMSFLEAICSKYAGVGGYEHYAEIMLREVKGVKKSLEEGDGGTFLRSYRTFLLYGLLLAHLKGLKQSIKYAIEEFNGKVVRIMREKCGCEWKEL
jgi:hypothetical protein